MILHLVSRAEWEAAPAGRPFTPAAYAADGFIHCTAGDDLLLSVANAVYRSRPGEFLVLSIDESKLSSPLKWEPATSAPAGVGAALAAAPAPTPAAPATDAPPSPGTVPPEAIAEFGAEPAPAAAAPPAPSGPLFPHIYGPLNRDAITGIRRAVRSADGTFTGYAPVAVDDRLPFQKAADDLLQVTDAFSESLARYKDQIEARMDELDKNIKDKL